MPLARVVELVDTGDLKSPSPSGSASSSLAPGIETRATKGVNPARERRFPPNHASRVMALACRRFPRGGTNTEPRCEPRRIPPVLNAASLCWRPPRSSSRASRSTSRRSDTRGSRSTSRTSPWSTAAAPAAVATTSALSITLLTTNEGPRAGLLESVKASEPKANVDLWGNLQSAFAPAQFPAVLQGYQSVGYQWSYTYWNQVSQDPAALEKFVSNVERLSSIGLEVEWEYNRSSGLPFTTTRVPGWLRRTRRRAKSRLPVRVDPTAYPRITGQLLAAG